jgi:BTB/POZ domain
MVGRADASFTVHKNLVCNISPFFRGACSSLFREGVNDVVCLPEQDPEAFDIFLEWMYTGRIGSRPHPPNKESAAESEAWWILVTKLYLLAHYLQSTSFGNEVIDLIGRSVARKQVRKNPQSDTIHLVYNSTVDGCGLRKLFVALDVWRPHLHSWTHVGLWKDYLEGCPAEFSQDLVVGLMRKNHQLDQDPFINERACYMFRDSELSWLPMRPAIKSRTEAAPPTKK